MIELAIALGLGGAIAAWQHRRGKSSQKPPSRPPNAPAPYRQPERPATLPDPETGGYPTLPFDDTDDR